jgi:hypothetical protein
MHHRGWQAFIPCYLSNPLRGARVKVLPTALFCKQSVDQDPAFFGSRLKAVRQNFIPGPFVKSPSENMVKSLENSVQWGAKSIWPVASA